MAIKYFDGVKEVSKTSGTGDYTLGGAVGGSYSVDSVLSNSDQAYFSVEMPGGPGREIFLGTFTSPSTLARTSIVSSSNSDAAVDWPSTGQRFITLIRRPDILYEICMFISGRLFGGADVDRTRVRIITTQGASFLNNFSGSVAFSRVDAAADIDFDINQIDSTNSVTNLGTMSITGGGNVASFTSVGGTAKTVSAGDAIEILAPVTPDTDLRDLAINFLGKRLP
jgi:hypothetical protein